MRGMRQNKKQTGKVKNERKRDQTETETVLKRKAGDRQTDGQTDKKNGVLC